VKFQSILLGALGIIIAVMMASTVTWEIEETETYFVSEPYTYEKELVNEIQRHKFLWFFEITQVQYSIKNTDSIKGRFVLNYIFDNGEKTATKTREVELLAGELAIDTMDSTLPGKSSVHLNVIPPNKSIPKERTVIKEVTVLDYLGLGWLKLLIK